MTPERERLVTENLPLAHACARRFLGRGEAYEDLAQAGCLGLIKAAAGFDPAYGCRFSTYAVPVILGEIRRLFREGGAVSLPRSAKDRLRRLRAAAEAFGAETGREPTVTELAAAAGEDPADCAALLCAAQAPLSLSLPEAGGFADLPVPGPEEAAAERADLNAALSRLPPADRALLRLRCVLGRTQAETGRLLGLSQVQVSRREKRLLARLREELR